MLTLEFSKSVDISIQLRLQVHNSYDSYILQLELQIVSSYKPCFFHSFYLCCHQFVIMIKTLFEYILNFQDHFNSTNIKCASNNIFKILQVLAIEHIAEDDLIHFVSQQGYKLYKSKGEDHIFVNKNYSVFKTIV